MERFPSFFGGGGRRSKSVGLFCVPLGSSAPFDEEAPPISEAPHSEAGSDDQIALTSNIYTK